jgi:uncharacterized protein (UPF0332 family)
MMRSAELQYCLDSPYLSVDPSVTASAPKDLEKAEKFLKEAPEKKDALDQLNTAYQAMYCAAQALLHSIGYRVTGFRCVLVALNEFFVGQGKLDRVHVDQLLRGQKVEGTPQENIEAAAALISAVKGVLGK